MFSVIASLIQGVTLKVAVVGVAATAAVGGTAAVVVPDLVSTDTPAAVQQVESIAPVVPAVTSAAIEAEANAAEAVRIRAEQEAAAAAEAQRVAAEQEAARLAAEEAAADRAVTSRGSGEGAMTSRSRGSGSATGTGAITAPAPVSDAGPPGQAPPCDPSALTWLDGHGMVPRCIANVQCGDVLPKPGGGTYTLPC